MSLITRCPACGTMFKVVPDQLRISEGWVRCGHCSEVFDATATLQSFAPEELAPITPGAAPPAPPPADPVRPSLPESPATPAPTHIVSMPDARAEAIPAEPDLVLDPAPLRDMAGAAFAPDSAPAFEVGGDTANAPPTPPMRDASLTGHSPLAGRDDLHWPDSIPSMPGVSKRSSVPADHTDEDVAAQEVSFVQDARRKARWRSTPVRAGLSILALLLATLLAGQAAYHERDRLAVLQPALRPWLVQGCEWLGCTVGPLRQIESVAIESSAFQRIRSDAYRLSLSLRNQSEWPLAMPAIELTLTDALDQPVVRRVLTPADLGSAAGVLAPQAEQPASVALAVATSGGQPRVAGYRILAFYP